MVLPGIRSQVGFLAGMCDEEVSVPSPLDGYLRKQQPASGGIFDDQTMSADLHIIWAGTWLERPQHRDLDYEQRQLFNADRGESWVLCRGGCRHAPDGHDQGVVGLHLTDAAT